MSHIWLISAILFAALLLLAWLHDARLRMAIRAGLPPAGIFVDTETARLHIVKKPSAQPQAGLPPIVLLHGSSGSAHDMMLALGDALSHESDVYSFDRPGIGRSVNLVSDRQMAAPEAQARAVHEAMQKLGLQKPVIIGHSWGGAVAIAYAQLFADDMTGAVMLGAPFYPWAGPGSWYNRLVTKPVIGPLFTHLVLTKYGLGQLDAGVAGNFFPEKVRPDYKEKSGLAAILQPKPFIANAVYSLQLSQDLAKMQHDYARITAPLLLVTGNRDQTVNAKRNSVRLHESLPQSALIYLRGVGHMLHHTQTAIIAEAVTGLARTGRVRAGRTDIDIAEKPAS